MTNQSDQSDDPNTREANTLPNAGRGTDTAVADSVRAIRTRRRARVTTEEHWEVVRAELLPMYIERRTLVEIAEVFGVSTNTAGTWRARLIDDLRNEATAMQPRDYVMESISSLRLARSEAWKTVRGTEDLKDRRTGLHLVTTVENQSTKLGMMIGLYGRAGDRPLHAVGSEDIDDEARQLRAVMLGLLSDAKDGTTSD